MLSDGARSLNLVWRLVARVHAPAFGAHRRRLRADGGGGGSTAARAWLMQPVLDEIFVGREGSLLLLIAAAALGSRLVKGIADYGEAVLMNRVGQRVIADVQKALFKRLIHADLAYFHGHPTGALISRFTNDAACCGPPRLMCWAPWARTR